MEGRSLLRSVSLSVRPGAFHGLIGHNGSGKSTLLKVLARQHPASTGSVLFAGRALDAWQNRDFARRIAYLPQALPPATGLSVRELVGFGRYPWRGPFGRLTTEDAARVEAAIADCGLDAFADRIVDTLSGGERQRAWLAMLIAQDSDFILLDEPVSALDLAQQVEILGLLRRLATTHRKGVLAVLHDINMAARFCDEITALKAGEIATRGAPAAIMRGETLEAIYGLPMEVVRTAESGRTVALPR